MTSRPGPDEEEGGAGSVPLLPEPVRARVADLAAAGLGRMAVEDLPPALRKVASFAPARRSRLAGSRIAGLLESDEEFRTRLAVQVRASAGDLADALLAGRTPPAADPVEVAALAYLLRVPGWPEVVASAGVAAEVERRAATTDQAADQVQRLRSRLEEAREEARRQRLRAQEQMEQLKADNAALRRKLGEARARAREAEAAADAAAAGTAGEAARLAQSLSAAEAEGRRARVRITELEVELAAARRSERSSRVGETVRAKLLVDTLVEAAQGLRRELGLPAVDRRPADSVAADVAADGTRGGTGQGAVAHDPAHLEQLLRLPRAHLVVDGYNVTKNALPDLPLEKQRERLLAGLAPLVARTGAEVTVVFDAAETRSRPVVQSPRGVRVLYSPFGVIADDVIRDLVAAEPAGRAVAVVSSDQEVATEVARAGFRTVEADALARLVLRGRG